MSSAQSSKQFRCLYTKQKTQKRKCWHDGRLVISTSSVRLYNAQPIDVRDPILDECELSRSQSEPYFSGAETDLETDGFLIQIQGPWSAPSSSSRGGGGGGGTSNSPSVSNGMRRVMNRKFRQPAPYVPPNPRLKNRGGAAWKQRRRPLQPGELERRHYGAPEQTQDQNRRPPLRNATQPGHQPSQVNRGPPLPPQPTGPEHNAGAATGFSLSGGNVSQDSRISQGDAPFDSNLPAAEDSPTPAGMEGRSSQPPRDTQVANNESFLVGNGFNRDHFYGEEEECPSDHDDGPDQFDCSQFQLHPVTHHDDEKQRSRSEDDNAKSDPRGTREAISMERDATSKKNPSRVDLLSLFGFGSGTNDTQAPQPRETGGEGMSGDGSRLPSAPESSSNEE